MQCNIDSRGKSVRLAMGFAQLVVAAVLAFLIVWGGLTSPMWWWVVAGSVAGGAFCIYEGWHGWCAVRAMGFKTPI